MSDLGRRNWEDLNVTKDELKNLSECLKDDTFRKLLTEYAKEVTDPENRKLYEKEITLLEKQRGVNVTFIHPEPGYVIKTSVDGIKKCFINISKNEIVPKPSSTISYEKGARGLQWSVPHTLLPPRDDLDKKNFRCIVFDVVFHPDTLHLAMKNERFRKIVNDTALDGIEKNFKVKVDRNNIKYPKLRFKGTSQPAVIRDITVTSDTTELDMEPEIYQKLVSSYDECRKSHKEKYEEKPKQSSPETKYFNERQDVQEKNNYTVPKYTIKHQSEIELDECRYSKYAKMHVTVPKELIIIIELPLLNSSEDATLDIETKRLVLKSDKPSRYYLDLPLPHSVKINSGSAKFDLPYKRLTVTLPVIRNDVSLEIPGTTNDHQEMNEEENEKDSPIIEIVDETKDEDLHDLTIGNDNISMKTCTMDNNCVKLLPKFSCELSRNSLIVTINEGNVVHESFKYRILSQNSGIHVEFESLGAGYFPIFYSFLMKIREESINPDVDINIQKNKVVMKITLHSNGDILQVFVGPTESLLECKNLNLKSLEINS